MTRAPQIGVALGVIASVGIGWGVLKTANAASGSTTSDLLALQSSKYLINGKEVTPPPSLLEYLPFLKSRQKAIAEVATLSVLCEVKADQAGLASSDYFRASMSMVGGAPADSPATLKWKQRVEERQKEFVNQLRAPLDDAVTRGLSDAFSKEDMLTSNDSAPKNGKMIGNIIAAQSDQYKTALALRRMQSALYDRCESLARSEAGAARLDGDGARVVVEGRRKRSMLQFWMVLRNQTGKDLHHVTLSILVPPPPAKTPDDPRLAGLLGGMVGAASGEDRAGEVVDNGSRFAKSVGDYEKLQAMPHRVFYHIPLLPAGQEVTTQLGGSPLGDSPVTFSLWCDEGAREHTKFDGLDELTAQVEEFKKEFLADREAAEARRKGSLFNGGLPPAERNGATKKNSPTNTGLSALGRKQNATPDPERARTGEAPPKLDYAQALQGSWKIIEQIENGHNISKDIRKNNWVITRTNNTFLIKSDLGFYCSGTWTVDDTKKPVEITQTVKRGHGAGKVRHLIINLEGDELLFCAGEQTPTTFRSPLGQNLVSGKAVRMPARGGADKGGALEQKLGAKGGVGAKPTVDIAALEQKANAGNAQSMYELGVKYFFEIGVVKDEKKGVTWVEKAAKAGNPGGMYSLATCYLNGICVKKDLKLADEWMRKAAAEGSPEAQKALARAGGGKSWQDMTGDQKANPALGPLILFGLAAAALSSDQPAAGGPTSACNMMPGFSPCPCRGYVKSDGRAIGGREIDTEACRSCEHLARDHNR